MADYEPLLGSPIDGNTDEADPDALEAARTPAPGSPRRHAALEDSDDALLGLAEPRRRVWAGVEDLDIFFTRIYTYWEEKGLVVILTARVLNVAALAFSGFVSAVLLLGLDYSAFSNPCIEQGTCNLWDVAVVRHPLSQGGFTIWKAVCCLYLVAFFTFWAFAVLHLVVETRSLLEVRSFVCEHLGFTDRALRSATWPEVASRIVAAQRSVRLCLTRDVSEADVAARIMRRDNYLIALLNGGVLALHPRLPGLRSRPMLSKTLEWNLRRCLLDPLFDDHFRIKPHFLQDASALRRRFHVAAVVNAALAPFLLAFLLTYFFLKNAEELYHHPSSIAARRWSPLARWRLREFNELPCFLNHRLNAGHAAAERYVRQFPNYTLSHIARFIAFVAGSIVAALLVLTVIDERFLEWDLAAGRQTVWWLALLGVVLAAARPAIIETSTAAFDPGLAMLEVAAHTHHLPRHWRGRAHTAEVQGEFESMFRYRSFLFFEELASVVLTPVMLWTQLPRCAATALQFIDQNTMHVDGLGDVCSLAAFEVVSPQQHGSSSIVVEETSTPQASASVAATDGKRTKSILSFAVAYPTWHPPPQGRELLAKLTEGSGGAATATATAHEGSRKESNASAASLLAQHPVVSLLSSQYPGLARWYLWQHSNDYGGTVHSDASGGRVGGDGLLRRDNSRSRNNNVGAAAAAEDDGVSSGLFASAEIFPVAAGFENVHDPGDRVALGHALLQSYYDNTAVVEEDDGEQQPGGASIAADGRTEQGPQQPRRPTAEIQVPNTRPRKWGPRTVRSPEQQLSMLTREPSVPAFF